MTSIYITMIIYFVIATIINLSYNKTQTKKDKVSKLINELWTGWFEPQYEATIFCGFISILFLIVTSIF